MVAEIFRSITEARPSKKKTARKGLFKKTWWNLQQQRLYKNTAPGFKISFTSQDVLMVTLNAASI